MCRFLAYHGPAITLDELLIDPSNSLLKQSQSATKRKKPLNGDGFGIGWYPTHDDPEPGCFVSIEPAWSNRNLKQISRKVKSSHFFGHVRDASVGMPVSAANCHPFAHNNFLFMHNGRLDKFADFRRAIVNGFSDQAFDLVKGNTDSEHAFAMFMDNIQFANQVSTSELKQAVYKTIDDILTIRKAHDANTNAFINFCVTDGKRIVTTRFASDRNAQPASLFYSQGKFDFSSSGDFVIDPSINESTVVSSEPLTEQKDAWHKVDRNHAVILDENGELTVEAIPVDYQT